MESPLAIRIRRKLLRFLHPKKYKEYYINLAIRLLKGTNYIEIGVRDGDCFRRISCKNKIGIDPIKHGTFKYLKYGEQFYDVESDIFFNKHAEKIFTNREIDVALVDGFHEFTQALRDVLNLEKYMSKNGVIFIHDLNPKTRKMAEILTEGEWNGDVWKVAYYLRHYRKDLNFFTINKDHGIGVITGLWNRSYSYWNIQKSILNYCKNIDYDYLESHRNQLLRLKSAKESISLIERLI